MSLESLAQMPLHDGPAVQAMFARVQAYACARGLVLRPPPAEPTTCCGRGCNGCVWEGFFAAAVFWREDALEALRVQGSV